MNKLGWYRHIGAEFFYYAPRALYRALKPLNDRNPNMVQQNYDGRYQELRDLFGREKPSLESYMYGKSTEPEWVLVNNKIFWTLNSEGYKNFLPQLEKYLQPYLTAGSTVVEFGCGSGRNLLYLKSKYPQARFMGIELSPVGVALAKEAAAAFNLDVQFMQADLTVPQDLGVEATISYSVFSMEQMPRQFIETAKTMAKTSGGKIVLFEPVPELYSWGVRGLTARFRAVVIDHVRHVLSTLKKNGFVIDYASRLGMGNPLTEATVVVAHTK